MDAHFLVDDNVRSVDVQALSRNPSAWCAVRRRKCCVNQTTAASPSVADMAIAQRGSAQQAKGVARIDAPARPDRADQVAAGQRGASVGGVARLRPVGRGRLERERNWASTVGQRLSGPRVVAFVAGKGGVGTTTTAAGVALTLATFWPAEVALADLRTGADSLGRRLGGIAAPHAADYAAGSLEPLRTAGVTVVDGAPWDTPLTRPTLSRVITDLREDHLFTVLDVGDDAGDIGHGALARVDRVVIVTSLALDAVSAAERTIGRLDGIDAELARTAVVAQTGVRKLSRRPARARPALPWAGTVVQLPWDAALDDSVGLNMQQWQRPTRAAYLELAAALCDASG